MVRMLIELEARLRRAIEENQEAAQRLLDKSRISDVPETCHDVAGEGAGPDPRGS